MDEVRNPFAPGAGSKPPELAGRERIVAEAEIAAKRIAFGRSHRSQILLGLRGTGKTVLLNTFEEIACRNGHETSFIEAPDDADLARILYPKVHGVLRRLSIFENAKAAAHAGMRALKSFAATLKISLGDVTIAVDPQPGIADSGDLELDLTDLFQKVGEAAMAAGRAWTLLVDEIQYLDEKELGAIIVALHRASQKGLPVLFFGAGLPQIAALSGNAKSYAERLFEFPPIEALPPDAAREAVLRPIIEEEEAITEEALDEIVELTEGYPYFLQEWGYQVWNEAERSPITDAHVRSASPRALQRLDDSFFRVRLDRLTPKEKEYVRTMARLGDGPYRSSEIADALGAKVTTLGPRRAKIIAKGMIYGPAHGDTAFTVPMFAEFLRRNDASFTD